MSLGPRLVIPGVLLGSTFLSIFLYLISASVNVPPAMAALPVAELRASSVPGEVAVQEQPAASVVEQGSCPVSSKFPEKILQWCDLITRYSNERGLPPDLIAALIWQESGGNPTIMSKSGAVGLMQVMPRDGIAASFMCVNGPCFSNRPSIAELEDPEFNVAFGTKYLAQLLAKHGDMRDALKAYGPMDVGYYYADKVLGLFQTYGNAN